MAVEETRGANDSYEDLLECFGMYDSVRVITICFCYLTDCKKYRLLSFFLIVNIL